MTAIHETQTHKGRISMSEAVPIEDGRRRGARALLDRFNRIEDDVELIAEQVAPLLRRMSLQERLLDELRAELRQLRASATSPEREKV